MRTAANCHKMPPTGGCGTTKIFLKVLEIQHQSVSRFGHLWGLSPWSAGGRRPAVSSHVPSIVRACALTSSSGEETSQIGSVPLT